MRNSLPNVKRVMVFIFFSLMIIAVSRTQAQSVSTEIDSRKFSSPNCVIQYFKAIGVNEKRYFKFLIIEHEENVAYVLESSKNGLDFNATQIKEGFTSPNSVPLLYCYQENLKDNENIAYRIKRVSLLDGTMSNSCSLILNNKHDSKKWVSCLDQSFNEEYVLVEEEEGRLVSLSSEQNDIFENTSERMQLIDSYEIDIESNVSIYPNPNKGKVNIDLGNLKNVSIKIFNVSGQLILNNENITSSLYQFEFNEMPGIYFVDINNQSETHRFTLMKK